MNNQQNNLRVINLDSINKANTDNYGHTWYFDNPVFDINGYSLKSFSGLNTIYNVDNRNNHLYPIVYTGTTGTLSDIKLTSGNYTISTIIPTLNLAFSSSNVVFTADTQANKISFSYTNENLLLSTGANSLYSELGFTPTQLNTLLGASTGSLTAQNIFDFSGVKKLNIISYDLGSRNWTALGKSNLPIIASIPINDAFMSVINVVSDPFIISTDVYSLNSISIQFLDENYRRIELANGFSLELYLSAR